MGSNRHMLDAPRPPGRRAASPTRAVHAVPLLSCVVLCVLATGCANGRAPAARFIEQAERLHDGALASTVTPDADLTEYIQEIGIRLERAAQEIAPDKARGPFFR